MSYQGFCLRQSLYLYSTKYYARKLYFMRGLSAVSTLEVIQKWRDTKLCGHLTYTLSLVHLAKIDFVYDTAFKNLFKVPVK